MKSKQPTEPGIYWARRARTGWEVVNLVRDEFGLFAEAWGEIDPEALDEFVGRGPRVERPAGLGS
jgi:hypothetical protein